MLAIAGRLDWGGGDSGAMRSAIVVRVCHAGGDEKGRKSVHRAGALVGWGLGCLSAGPAPSDAWRYQVVGRLVAQQGVCETLVFGGLSSQLLACLGLLIGASSEVVGPRSETGREA